MSILKLLASPEGKTLELKEKMPTSLAIAKTVCAFSNGAGGSIIIGIRDRDKTLEGIDELDISDTEEQVSSIIYDIIEPIPSFSTTIHKGGKRSPGKCRLPPGLLEKRCKHKSRHNRPDRRFRNRYITDEKILPGMENK